MNKTITISKLTQQEIQFGHFLDDDRLISIYVCRMNNRPPKWTLSHHIKFEWNAIYNNDAKEPNLGTDFIIFNIELQECIRVKLLNITHI